MNITFYSYNTISKKYGVICDLNLDGIIHKQITRASKFHCIDLIVISEIVLKLHSHVYFQMLENNVTFLVKEVLYIILLFKDGVY